MIGVGLGVKVGVGMGVAGRGVAVARRTSAADVGETGTAGVGVLSPTM